MVKSAYLAYFFLILQACLLAKHHHLSKRKLQSNSKKLDLIWSSPFHYQNSIWNHTNNCKKCTSVELCARFRLFRTIFLFLTENINCMVKYMEHQDHGSEMISSIRQFWLHEFTSTCSTHVIHATTCILYVFLRLFTKKESCLLFLSLSRRKNWGGIQLKQNFFLNIFYISC